MKYIYIILLVVLFSCTEQPATKEKYNPQYRLEQKHRIIIIDGCEYIIINDGNKGFMSHKGNCKNCTK